MKNRNRFIVFVSAVISDGDRFLILKRSTKLTHHPGMWSIVSVSVRSGETPEAAIRRGVVEETGIIIQPIRIFQTYNFFYENDPKQESVGFVFECRFISGQISLCEAKNSQYKWIKSHEIGDYNFTGTVKENLLEAANIKLTNQTERLRIEGLIKHNLSTELNSREKELLDILMRSYKRTVDIQTISERFTNKIKGEDPSYTLIYKTISTLRRKIEKSGTVILSRGGGYEILYFGK